jgi:hypothetical protein
MIDLFRLLPASMIVRTHRPESLRDRFDSDVVQGEEDAGSYALVLEVPVGDRQTDRQTDRQ